MLPACKRIWATERKKMKKKKKLDGIKSRNNNEKIQKQWLPQMIKIRRIVSIIKKNKINVKMKVKKRINKE